MPLRVSSSMRSRRAVKLSSSGSRWTSRKSSSVSAIRNPSTGMGLPLTEPSVIGYSTASVARHCPSRQSARGTCTTLRRWKPPSSR